MALPERFKERMKDILKDDYPAFSAAFENESAVRALRVNTLKSDRETFLSNAGLSLSPLPFSENGFIFKEEKVGGHPLHHAGAFYAQDPGAMCSIAAVAHLVRADMKVLDLCAAPGGKSTFLASLAPEGALLSNEIDRSRARVLRSNLERMGVARATLTSTDSEDIASSFGSVFDFVCVDAPCSGEGMMRKYEEAVLEWSEENVLMCARRQAEILENAKRCTAPGGYLLYSTCTFSLEENEMTVDAFLKRNPDFSIVPVSESVRAVTAEGINFEGYVNDMTHCRRFYPHIYPGEGQFLCLMQRSAESEGYIPRQKKKAREKTPAPTLSKSDLAILEKFFSENLELSFADHSFSLLGDTVMMSDDLFSHKAAMVCGVAVGSIVKSRLEPHHHLFSALGKSFKRRIELSSRSAKAVAYLAGEVIDTNEKNGWCAVLIDGCPAGGGKIVDGKVKNHYPKGLRSVK